MLALSNASYRLYGALPLRRGFSRPAGCTMMRWLFSNLVFALTLTLARALVIAINFSNVSKRVPHFAHSR